MFLARIIKTVTSTVKHRAYEGRIVYVIQPVMPDGADTGPEIVAVDYVGSNIGDTVVCGGAPGVAKEVFNIDRAPIRTLIMAIADTIENNG
jgi:ethanolamine utilization protein EutN